MFVRCLQKILKIMNSNEQIQENPLVSIIINCFNGEDFLNSSLNSVLCQEYQNWEIIFIDNSSTDTSKKIFLSYNDNSLKYFSTSNNVTLAKARNMGFNQCQGELIAFLDVDDEWFPQKLTQQVNLFKNLKVGISCSSYIKVNERGSKELRQKIIVKKMINEDATKDLLSEYFVHISTFIFRSSLLKEFEIRFDERFSIIEDIDFALKLSLISNITTSTEPLATYRWHDNNYGYISDYKLGSEFGTWIKDAQNIKQYGSFDAFQHIKLRAEWYLIVKQIYDGEKLKYIKIFFKVDSVKKLKLIFGFILPKVIVRRLINRN